MTDENNVVRLASVNNDVRTDGAAARELVVAFLREWADAIEGGDEVTKAVLILYNDVGENFRIRTRRCNTDLVQQVGIVGMALSDLCTATSV